MDKDKNHTVYITVGSGPEGHYHKTIKISSAYPLHMPSAESALIKDILYHVQRALIPTPVYKNGQKLVLWHKLEDKYYTFIHNAGEDFWRNSITNVKVNSYIIRYALQNITAQDDRSNYEVVSASIY